LLHLHDDLLRLIELRCRAAAKFLVAGSMLAGDRSS